MSAPQAGKVDIYFRLCAKVKDCQLCKLGNLRTGNAVFGSGDLDAQVMIVGEAPGVEEEKHGIPFYPEAPAGNVLKELVTTVLNVPVYVTNTVCCRPVSNSLGKQNGKPDDGDIIACSAWLDQQIQLVSPKVIIALGGYAGLRLCGISAPSRARGNLYWYKGIPVVPSWHPAYVARNGGKYGDTYVTMQADFELALAVLKDPSLHEAEKKRLLEVDDFDWR